MLDVRKILLTDLQTKLGAKMGQTLFQFSRGLDDRVLTRHKQRQSVSAEVNVNTNLTPQSTIHFRC